VHDQHPAEPPHGTYPVREGVMTLPGRGTAAQPVIRRLNTLLPLSDRGVAALERVVAGRIRHADANQELVSEGHPVRSVRMILSGWLCRQKILEDGRRQIVSFILPGDTCDAHAYLLPAADHTISTLTPVVYGDLNREDYEALVASDRSLAEALCCEMLVNMASQREWAVSLGRRDALERVAHLFCELLERLRPVGLAEGNACDFPVTQLDLADATGLSAVHVNRIIQELRGTGLIALRARTLTVSDFEALKSVALFNANYLRPGRRGSPPELERDITVEGSASS
jgi:CRP-like cAMP-binding protein